VRWVRRSAPHRDRVRYSGLTQDLGPHTEYTEVWWLDEQGRLLITVVNRRSDSEVETRTLTYRRQSDHVRAATPLESARALGERRFLRRGVE